MPNALYLIDQNGDPIGVTGNPLEVSSGGGGGGTVDQGETNGDATKGWSARLTDGAAFIVPAKTGQLPAALGATNAAGSVSVGIAIDQLSTLATAAKQDTGNASLSSIDSKVATAANQTTANSSLASILGQLDNKTSTLATEATASASKTLLGAGLPTALVGGKLDVNLGTSSITLSVGQATAANLNATVAQGTGSGSAATFWYTRVTDGTNTLPTMDTAARSGFQRITDGTNTAAVKAASTAPTASDTALVATLSPNSRPGGGSSFSWFSTATGSLLKTGAGVVRRIVIGSNVAGTVTLHDNTSATGTVIASVTSTTSTPCNPVELGVAFSTGLYCTTTGSGISVTVVYD